MVNILLEYLCILHLHKYFRQHIKISLLIQIMCICFRSRNVTKYHGTLDVKMKDINNTNNVLESTECIAKPSSHQTIESTELEVNIQCNLEMA